MFFPETDAIMFVLDSSDPERFEIARDYIKELFVDEILDARNIPIAIFCNKQDSEEKMDKNKIREYLDLEDLTKRPGIKYSLRSGSGNECSGITDCLDWLCKNIKTKEVKLED